MIFKPESLNSVFFVFVQFISYFALIYNINFANINLYLILAFILFALIGFWAMLIMKFKFNIAPEFLEDNKLIRGGPYKFIRHPMYTSVIGTGFILLMTNVSIEGVIFWVILLIDLIYKIDYEENLLIKEYPEYLYYRKKTKKLFPFFY